MRWGAKICRVGWLTRRRGAVPGSPPREWPPSEPPTSLARRWSNGLKRCGGRISAVSGGLGAAPILWPIRSRKTPPQSQAQRLHAERLPCAVPVRGPEKHPQAHPQEDAQLHPLNRFPRLHLRQLPPYFFPVPPSTTPSWRSTAPTVFSTHRASPPALSSGRIPRPTALFGGWAVRPGR